MATWLVAAMLLLGLPLASSASGDPAPEATSEKSEQKVQAEVDGQLRARREARMQEAHAALDETRNALQALEQDERDEALEALARATGKLELLLARDPELALAPVDVDLIEHDLYATPAAIRQARDEAAEMLDEGRVQEARALLAGLASEIRIRVTNLPLASYPDAIKAVSPLIDDGRIDEAKQELRAALATLVVTDQVIALPVLRARSLLDEAEALAAKEGGESAGKTGGESAAEDRERARSLVEAARQQLEMAELLGYGGEEAHEHFHAQIAELEKKIGADQDTTGTFARLRRSLSSLEQSLFE